MSFIIKCGYDAFYRNIINVKLKQTNLWSKGSVMVNGIKFNIDSSRDNLVEIVKYDDTNTLLVNNAIIYDNRKLFSRVQRNTPPHKLQRVRNRNRLRKTKLLRS